MHADRASLCIVPADELPQRKKPSDAAGTRQLAGHLALLGCTAAAIWASLGSGWVAPAMLLHGIVQVSLFAPLHESTHLTAFRARWLNDVVAGTIGFVHFLPAVCFRCFHLAHHRFTQDPERDPELQTPKPTTIQEYLRHASGIDYWYDRFVELMRHAAGHVDESWVPAQERSRVSSEARWHLTAYLLVTVAVLGFGWTLPLFYWLLPALLGQPFLRLYLLAEHTSCPQERDPTANTRTTLTNPLVRFLMWNMPYHAEHHTAPGVPFHALPALHDLLSDGLEVTARGYTRFHWSYAWSLRNRTV